MTELADIGAADSPAQSRVPGVVSHQQSDGSSAGSIAGDMTARPLVRFENVSKRYPVGDTTAVDDVSLSFHAGEFVFLVGSSGSGKSTMLKLLTRETLPTAGNVFVDGIDTAKVPARHVPRLRRRYGCVYQDFKLLANRTVAENVAFAMVVTGHAPTEIQTRVPAICELVGLADKMDAFPAELSGGQAQRASIARAFVNRPKFLVADEPTGNLDPETAVGIMRLLSRINRTGTMVIMATHDRSIVDRMRRRVVSLDGGVVARDSIGGYDPDQPDNTDDQQAAPETAALPPLVVEQRA